MKNRVLSVLFASVIGSACVMSACDGGQAKDKTSEFMAAVEHISLPVTKNSAQAINKAYDSYYSLSEDEQRNVKSYKATLDGYAEICNAIIELIYNANGIGKYSAYSEYYQKISVANEAYSTLAKINGEYLSDSDVVAAKQTIDDAKAVYDGKTAQIEAYIDAVSAIGEYNASETLFTEWSSKIAAAEVKYSVISSPDDDIRSLPQVSESRVTLRNYNSKKEELGKRITTFADKVEAADKAYTEAFGADEPVYDESVNKAFDAVEKAWAEALAFNLLEDISTIDIRSKWAALTDKYFGVRYTTSFGMMLSGIEAMMEQPAVAMDLEKKLSEAESEYNKIPEADREKVSQEKELFDRAKLKLPELKIQKTFIDSVGAIDFTKTATLNDAKSLIDDAQNSWIAFTDNYEYTSGIAQLDEAKAEFDRKYAEFENIENFINAVEVIPAVDEIVNTRELYLQLKTAERRYAVLSALQQKYTLVLNANLKLINANNKMESLKTDMISETAWDKAGEEVAFGLKILSFNEDGLISGNGSNVNYLQILYSVAATRADNQVNGITINEQNCTNADADEVKTYMSENFEYVFYLYNSAGKKLGSVCKDMVFDEDAQVPDLEEIQKFFPLYHNEDEQVSYSFGMEIRVKEHATDDYLHCQFRDIAEVKAEASGAMTGDTQTEARTMLSPANLVAIESEGVLQIMRAGNIACAYTKSLNYKYVGAYEIYFYRGTEVKEENLVEWIRVVKETEKVGDYNHVANAYVRTFLGSSLEEKGLVDIMLTDQEYIAANVMDVTATVPCTMGMAQHKNHGWLISSKKGYNEAFTTTAAMSNLFSKLGYDLKGSEVTITTKLCVNDAGKEAGIKDSPFSEPICVLF